MTGERILPGAGLTAFYDLGSDGWKAGFDTNIQTLSAIAQITVTSRVPTVPGSPTDGDMYILTSDNTIALYDNGAWYYLTPIDGWIAYSVADLDHFKFDGSEWVLFNDFTSFTLDYLATNLAAGHSVAEGEMAWNADDGTIDIGLQNGVVLQAGQEMHIHAKAVVTIADGEIVYASGAVGASGKIEVSKFIADDSISEIYMLGVATQAITSGSFGYITTFGAVRGVATDGVTEGETWVDGTVLYASPTVAGRLTNVKPTAPDQKISVAMVVVAHASAGTLYVRPSRGSHIGDLHDVDITTPADEDTLKWATDKWVNSPAGDLSNVELAAISESKAVTAVAGFVYDTSLDSDGGAWRTGWRALASSWYWETLNTATRGARREFPAVAVIIAEADKVTIYDGDDPALPMWMVFLGNYTFANSYMLAVAGAPASISCVSALNGAIYVGSIDTSASALNTIEFTTDQSATYRDTGYSNIKPHKGIAERNYLYALIGTDTHGSIISDVINDVAITVLPDAPIDEATGLPTPTIAVATDGGVSVITDGGDVWDAISGVAEFTTLDFTSSDQILAYTLNLKDLWVFDIPSADITLTDAVNADKYVETTIPAITATNSYGLTYKEQMPVAMYDNMFAYSKVETDEIHEALGLVATDTTIKENGMVAYLTSAYNSGWMQGDIKGCLLSSTAITSLVGEIVNDDFTGYVDQAAATTAGYVFELATFDAVNDQVDFTGGSDRLNFNGVATFADGERLLLEVVTSGRTVGSLALQENYIEVLDIAGNSITTDGTYYFEYSKNGALNNTRLTTIDFDGSVDSIKINRVVEDRSVNNNGIVVYGTIDRTPVATGAELVAYSGFSATDYLEQPYNADLDFGTGDFHAMGWVEQADAANDYVIHRSLPSAGLDSFTIFADGLNDRISFNIGLSSNLNGTAPIYNNGWNHVVCLRLSGVAYIYVNGILDVSVANTNSATVGATAVTRIGAATNGNGSLGSGSLALLRIGASAPSAAQIAKMYEDEKHLFQENALATISADAVTSLAVDPFTGLLEVGTTNDIDTISGITPIKRSTDDAGTFISVVDGLRISQ